MEPKMWARLLYLLLGALAAWMTAVIGPTISAANPTGQWMVLGTPLSIAGLLGQLAVVVGAAFYVQTAKS